ncbi:MAG: hypothetical protein V4519_01245 [Patescibacteria group bacterium]
MEPNILPGSWSLIKKAWAEVKVRYSYIFPVLGIMFIAQSLPLVIASKMIDEAVFQLDQYGSLTTQYLIIIAIVLVTSIVSFISTIVLMTLISKKETEVLTLRELYSNAVRLAIPYAWVSILIALAIVPGLVLLIVPGILLTLLVSFAGFALIIDNDRGLSALTRSWFYVKNNFKLVIWRFLGFVLFAIIITIVIAIIESIVGISMYGSAEYLKMIDDQTTPITSTIINNIVQTFVLTPIGLMYFWYLYEFMKIKEGPVVNPEEAILIRKRITILTIVGALITIALVIAFGYFFFTVTPL